MIDKRSIYEESLKKNVAKYTDQNRTQGTGTSTEGARPAKRMAVGSFPPQRSQGLTSGNPLFCCKRIRLRSYARSVTVCTKDPTGWQPGLVIVAAISVTSVRIAWVRELLRSLWHQLRFMQLFQESQKED